MCGKLQPSNIYLLYEFSRFNGMQFLSAYSDFETLRTDGLTYESLIDLGLSKVEKPQLLAKELIYNTPGPALATLDLDGNPLKEVKARELKMERVIRYEPLDEPLEELA